MKFETRIKLWRLFLWALRAATLRLDDWIQAQEVKLREPAARAAALAEVAPAASSRREKARRAAKSRRARLVYQHGQFVRQGGAA